MRLFRGVKGYCNGLFYFFSVVQGYSVFQINILQLKIAYCFLIRRTFQLQQYYPPHSLPLVQDRKLDRILASSRGRVQPPKQYCQYPVNFLIDLLILSYLVDEVRL